MAYDPGAMEAALAAVVGDDSRLIAELRTAFLDSADSHRAALHRARDEVSWQHAATRLKGLAASFGAVRVIDAATAALVAPVGDIRALRRIDRAVAVLREG